MKCNMFSNFCRILMPRKSVNTMLQADLSASRSLMSNSKYEILHKRGSTDGYCKHYISWSNVSMLGLCVLPQCAGAWLTAVRLTGRRQHKGTDALWWWRQRWGAASSSSPQPPYTFCKLANCRKQPNSHLSRSRSKNIYDSDWGH